ncbi:DUF3035 domain-containing protein [Marinibacterium sp. SX1]|uniref:DUF3035 domain-containing protein n=1 Tax=Marinibacterium sp. SX1 TaxID=3388424 RepID=UPI003D1854AD
MNPQRILQIIGRVGTGLGLGLLVAACSGNDGLRQLNTPRTGPDEFRVLPSKPLQEPDSYTFLPVPTPGGGNRTDPSPDSDAVVALGGSAAALDASQGVPSRDGAIVTYSSRYGVTANIRQVLAEADAAFRKRKGRFTNIRIVPVDRYNQAYEEFALDPFAEAERFRRAGIPTPSSPPRSPQ